MRNIFAVAGFGALWLLICDKFPVEWWVGGLITAGIFSFLLAIVQTIRGRRN